MCVNWTYNDDLEIIPPSLGLEGNLENQVLLRGSGGGRNNIRIIIIWAVSATAVICMYFICISYFDKLFGGTVNLNWNCFYY